MFFIEKLKFYSRGIKCIVKVGNLFHYSVQILLSSRFLSNLRVKIYKIILSHVFYMVVKHSPLTLREERRLKVFENRIPTLIFGLMSDDTGD
jgi:hypothetical protein